MLYLLHPPLIKHKSGQTWIICLQVATLLVDFLCPKSKTERNETLWQEKQSPKQLRKKISAFRNFSTWLPQVSSIFRQIILSAATPIAASGHSGNILPVIYRRWKNSAGWYDNVNQLTLFILWNNLFKCGKNLPVPLRYSL